MTTEVDLTPEAFACWVRAHRPPFNWFLTLDTVTQEALAAIGDQITLDRHVSLGNVIHDPEVAKAGIEAARGEVGGEEILLGRIVEQVAKGIVEREEAPSSPPKPPQSMAGLGGRSPLQVDPGQSSARPDPLFGGAPA